MHHEKYWQRDHDAQISKLFPMGLMPLQSKRPRSDEYLNQEAENAKTLSLTARCVSTFGSSLRYYEEFYQIKRKALREVQALSCLGYHENVVRYFSSWSENDFLYIQMKLCEINLQDEMDIHGKEADRGNVSSLTNQIDGTISIEDGDLRYLPMELINDDHSHLDKADMFSLGVTFYELARYSLPPVSGRQYQAIC
ncbi:hypothetical protein SELMODRAFT_427336 [Selaginella moellendorffii]|uniref:Protein kinase domain-containing protein n=1 Tax=Selaginella moellendorffii TaxID=88036 RepID=D8SZ92_SELML|nr:hypothetical protein SELMODRAFT_427336 [Selaginella moellendorffii]